MKRASYAIALAVVLLIGVGISAPAGAQQQPGGFTNLQVWPKDTSRAVIMQFMNAFDDSLGITCARSIL